MIRDQDLIDAAVAARTRAYAPYSRFAVGVTLLGSALAWAALDLPKGAAWVVGTALGMTAAEVQRMIERSRRKAAESERDRWLTIEEGHINGSEH